jgi:hypothetical protein
MIRGGCALDAGAIEFLFRIPEHAVKQEADSEPEDVWFLQTASRCIPSCPANWGDFRKLLT